MEVTTIALDARPLCEIKMSKDDVMMYPQEVARFVKSIIERKYGAINIDFDNWTIEFANPSNDAQQYNITFTQAPADNEVVILITRLHFGYVVE